MKALGLTKKAPRSHTKRRRMVRAAVKKLAAMKKFPNPKRRRRVVRKAAPKRVVRRHANPGGSLIGTSPILHVRGRRFAFPGARLVTGSTGNRVNVEGIRGKRYPLNHRVMAIDYRHDAKAMRAYGRKAPFRHKFTCEARVISAGSGKIVIESSRSIWEKKS